MIYFLAALLLSPLTVSLRLQPLTPTRTSTLSMASYSSYFDELNLFKAAEKKVLVGFTTDSWNVGTQKYKAFLAVNKMIKMIAKTKISAIDIPMFEVAQGPHYDELQKLFESFWIPDFSSTEQFLLQFDLIVIPDPVLAKYMVESYYEKEAKVAKKTAFFQKLSKQPWGVLDQYPPKERYEYERFKNLPRQKWIRKYPPIAVVGRETYNRMKNHGQVEYFSEGVEDFSLYLPDQMVPSKKVLVLRYKNRFGTLVDSLSLKGMNVTSAYPVTWMRKEWSPQEERLAKEVDVVYFHEVHAVLEWHSRLGDRVGSVVAACQNEEVAKAAKVAGFRDVFFAKKGTSDVLYKTILDAVDHAKTIDKNAIKK